jgi:hypothetical protein
MAKLFAGVLVSSTEVLSEVRQRLHREFGKPDYESEVILFDSTDYYEPQMGHNLTRRFYGFEQLVRQESLAALKLATNKIEDEFRGRLGVARPVNIDPGLLLPSKVILASCKDFSHRVYLSDGVYAEITLQYVHGKFETLPWTFPDYRTETYHRILKDVRDIYMRQIRS